MTLSSILANPIVIGLLSAAALAIVGAAVSATSVVTRESRPALSRWLAAFAAALPGDVARMKLDPLPPVPAPAKPADPPAPGPT